MSHILIVDDEAAFCRMLEAAVAAAGYRTRCASSAEAALEIVAESRPSLIFMDIRMSRGSLDGLSALKIIRERHGDLPVVVVTAYGDVQTAVMAMKAGALDFLEKPLDLREVREILRQAVGGGTMPGKDAEPIAFGGITPTDSDMQAALELLYAAAESDAPVLITGESGTGKELAASFVHERSPRAAGPFVKVNCASIPGPLLESEMFGHEAGAFTGAVKAKPGKFETAHRGTLLLDEIAEMDARLQAKLLRALQEKEVERVGGTRPAKVDVRIVATTNQKIAEVIRNGAFREDLYFRLNVFEVALPPLRKRRADIMLLAGHFAGSFSPHRPKRISAETESALLDYGWPGNVRELRNVMERASILARGGVIHPSHLPPALRPGSETKHEEGEETKSVHEMEKRLILKTLEEMGGNRTRAAEALCISRRTLLYKLKRYGVDY